MINQGSEFAMMARMALAAMESEADCKERKLFCSTDTARMRKVISASAGTEDAPLYRHAQPASERDQVRSAHAEWSQATFGNVGPVGPLKHLSKEALEAAEQPGDLSEWADMQFLLWDAQRRAGITDDQITQAMIDKLAVNKQREWPEPKDGEPRLHIKEQPAPVVPEEWTIADAVKFCKETGRQDAGAAMDAWNACRAAMLQTKSLTSINPAPDLVSLQKKAESIIGNYPGIPDGLEHCPYCGKKLRRACSVEGCGGKHVAHGLCQKHYDMKRWEDPEQVERFREAGRRYRGKKKSTVATPQEPKP
ncbi:DUF550 domain-containing protein [Klebsiella quasipneumoniae]|uniref:DUF550 domain-containing protein n=2 Tax=Klebsiella pneumoniae complex TaxID=3390273 RepID=UPI00352B3FE5